MPEYILRYSRTVILSTHIHAPHRVAAYEAAMERERRGQLGLSCLGTDTLDVREGSSVLSVEDNEWIWELEEA